MRKIIGKISSGTYLPEKFITEADPTVPEYVKAITEEDIAKWNSGTGTGGGGIAEETDPTVPSHVKAITQEQITKWDNSANTESGVTEETDPTVPSHVKNITEENIEDWNNKSDFSGSWNDLADRPGMYDGYERTMLVDNIEFTSEVYEGQEGSSVYGIPNWPKSNFTSDMSYANNMYVVYDGVTYHAPYFQSPDYSDCWGNAALFWKVHTGDESGQNDTGEPFAIGADGYFAGIDTEATKHTMTMYLQSDEIVPVKIPEKYLPEHEETDPTVPEHVKAITEEDITKWNAASGNGFSGDYNDLSNKPSIPNSTSDLTNDSGFITSYTETDPTVPSHVKAITQEQITKWDNGTASSGGTTDYTELTNKPKINNVELTGNVSLDTIGAQPKGDYALKSELPSNTVSSTAVTNIVSLSQTEYDSLGTKEANTLYLIVG